MNGAPTVRLFVSSTFADFQLERQVLHEVVFPRIARYCERRGATFQPVDLRWGVTDQLAADQQTMQVCLDEIRRSQQISPRPNFLVLLGDRYGWRPLPDSLPAPIHHMLSELADAAELAELQARYARDDNAVPCAWRLRRRDERGGVPEGDDAHLRALLSRGARQLGDATAAAALDAAATHQEVILAALGPEADSDQVVAWLRAFDTLPASMPADWLPADYLIDGAPDNDAARRLAQLKRELRAALVPARCADAAVPLDAYRAADGDSALAGYVRRFARHVLAQLLKLIRLQVAALRALVEDDPEDAAHGRFGAARQDGLVGRDAVLRTLAQHLNGPLRQPLVVTGAGGSGKTSILAGAAGRLRRGVAIVRYIGATPASATLRGLVAGVCAHIDRAYQPAAAAPLADDEPLAAALAARLRLASARRPLYLVIDALDQLPAADQASKLRWLPAVLPPHVHVLLSCRDGLALPPRARLLAVPALAPADAGRLLQDWLDAAGRTLTAPQRQAVADGYAARPLPLWLRLASELARSWHGENAAPPLPATLDGMIALVFAGLRRRHAPLLLSQAMAYLGGSRYGLSEMELMRLLARDPLVRAEFEGGSRYPWDLDAHGLPPVLWSRLRMDLGPYLIERAVDGALLLTFFHREFLEVVRRDFLAPQAGAIHAALADHFSQPAGPDLPLLVAQGRVAALRRLSEQAGQLTAAGDAAGLQALLSDFAFVMAKCGGARLPDLLHDYAGAAAPAALAPWLAFLRSHATLLAQADAAWPAYKVLLQLAQEQAPGHPVARASSAWLALGACRWRWARRMLRPTMVQAPAILAQFKAPAGQEGAFNNAIELGPELIATLAWDTAGEPIASGADSRVRIWNSSTGLLQHELADAYVMRALPGDRLITLATDGYLRIWSTASGDCLVAWELERENACDVLPLDGQRLLLAYHTPARVECRRIDGLALLASALPGVGWCGMRRLHDGLVFLSDRSSDDQVDVQGWLWDVNDVAPRAIDCGRSLVLDDGRAALWNQHGSWLILVAAGAPQRGVALPGPASALLPLADGRLAAMLADGRIAIIDWRSGMQLSLRPAAVLEYDAGPDGPSYFCGACVLDDGALLGWQSCFGGGHIVTRWDAGGATLSSWSGPGVLYDLAPGSAGRVMARFSDLKNDGHRLEPGLLCWRAADGAVLAALRGHANFCEHASWMSGDRVLSWSEDEGTVRTWDAASGRQLAMFNVEGFINRPPLRLADGSLLVIGYDIMFRFNLEHLDEPRPPCGGVRMADGLSLAWRDGARAVLWRGAERKALSVIGNSGDIASAQRLDDCTLVWDRALSQWQLWRDGARRLLLTLAAPADLTDELDAAFLLCKDHLLAALPLDDDAMLVRRLPLDGADAEAEQRIALDDISSFSLYALGEHCLARVGDQGVAFHLLHGAAATQHTWKEHQQLKATRLLAGARLLCGYGRTLYLWGDDGGLIASRLLPEILLDVTPLPGPRLLVCMAGGVLMLDDADLQPCWSHHGEAPWRFTRASASPCGRLLLESGDEARAAVDVMAPDGIALCRVEGWPAGGDTPAPLLSGDMLLVFGAEGVWQRWDLTTRRLCGDYRGVPEYAKVTLLDQGRVLWCAAEEPRLFDVFSGALLQAAQERRAGIWLRAAPVSMTRDPGLALLTQTGWPDGETVFWTNGANRAVLALSDASHGKLLLKGAAGILDHQHRGVWIELMDGATPSLT